MARIQMTKEEVLALEAEVDRGKAINELLEKHGFDPQKPWRVDTSFGGNGAAGEIRTGRNIGRPRKH